MVNAFGTNSFLFGFILTLRCIIEVRHSVMICALEPGRRWSKSPKGQKINVLRDVYSTIAFSAMTIIPGVHCRWEDKTAMERSLALKSRV